MANKRVAMERSRLRKPTVGMVHEESENYRKVQQLKIPEALYLSTQTLEKNYRDLANRNDASKVALKQLAKDTNLNISKANDCIAALGRYEKARDDLTARTQDHETRVAREKLEKGLDQLRQKFQAIMKALNITTDPGQAPTLFMPEDDADHELLSSLLGAPPGPGYSSERLVQALRQQRHTLQTEIDRLSSQHLQDFESITTKDSIITQRDGTIGTLNTEMTGLRSDLAQTQQQVTNLEAKVDLVTQERDKEQQNVANVTADLTKERKEAQNLQEQLSALGNTHQELANDKAAVEQQFQAFRNQDDAGRAAQYERDVADWKRLYQELVIQKREEAENLQEKVDMAEGEAEDAELERASTESKFQSALENMQAKDAAMTALKEKLREAREGSQDVIAKLTDSNNRYMSAYEKMLDRLPATVLHVLISSTDTSGLSTLTREDMQDLLRAFDIDPRTAFAPALLKRLRTDAGDYNSAPPTDNDVNMPDSQPQITSVEVTVRPLPRVWTSSGRFDDVASPLQSLTSVGGVLFLLVDEGRLSVSRTDHEMDDLVFLNQKIMTATWTAEDLLVVSPCIYDYLQGLIRLCAGGETMPSLIMCLAAMTLASWLARYPCDLNATQINVDLQELATLGMPAPGLARIGLLRLMQVVHQHGGPLPPPSAETEGEAAGEAEVSEQGPFIKMLLNMSTEYLKYDLPALLRAHETSAFLAYGDEDPGSVFFADNSSDPGSKAALIVERKDNEVQTEMIVLDSPFGEDALYYGWKEMQVEQADDGCFYILLTLYDGETVKIPESATLLSEYIVEAHFEEYNAAMDVLANAMTE